MRCSEIAAPSGPFAGLTGLIAALAALLILAPQSLAQAAAGAPAASAPHNAPESFSRLSSRLMPAVVNISTRQTVGRGAIGGFPEGSPLEEFNEFFGRDDEGAKRVSSLGSGFIIDIAGHVVTNNHVIENADEIDVILSDGTQLRAELVGRDPETDLALLKIAPPSGMKFVRFGDSDTAQVGDWVIAIGNPFGLGGTVTAGIVSARDRNINAGQYDDFIQTDAAINKGNSGGPLFNLSGEVIGVNTAIYSPAGSGGSVGVGFAVPSNLVRQIVEQLRDTGAVRRGWLGVRIQSVSQDIAESYGLARPVGAIITSLTEDGPAARAGLKVGDLITSLNGVTVKETRNLSHVVATAPIGQPLVMKIIRKGQAQTVSVTLGELDKGDAPEGVTLAAQDAGASELSNVLGVALAQIGDEDRRRYRIPRSVTGVLVSDIETGSDAMGKLSRGDVITEVNFTPVSDPDKAIAEAELMASRGKPVLVQFYRDGDISFRSIRPRKQS